MQFLNNYVNCLQFNIRYEKVERPAPMGGAFVSQNAETAHPLEQMRASSNQIIVFT